jgi:superfamily II DNA/RNA helicase
LTCATSRKVPHEQHTHERPHRPRPYRQHRLRNTLAFGLALLARTAGQRAEAGKPLGLILVPARELTQQVTDALAPYARSVKLRLATLVGEMPIGRQVSALRGGAEVVVATPGRLKDLIGRGACRLPAR